MVSAMVIATRYGYWGETDHRMIASIAEYVLWALLFPWVMLLDFDDVIPALGVICAQGAAIGGVWTWVVYKIERKKANTPAHPSSRTARRVTGNVRRRLAERAPGDFRPFDVFSISVRVVDDEHITTV